MTWTPLALTDLETLIADGLRACTAEDRALFERTAIPPERWRLPPWGDPAGGFWVVALLDARVLWYNDIEDGFNVSTFTARGQIGEYWCNQDELCHALSHFRTGSGYKLGPSESIPEG